MKKTVNPSANSSTKAPKKKPHPFWRVFWLTFLVASLGYAWYSFYVPSNDVVWADDMVTAQKLANDSGKNMLLFFTGKWCVPCRIMKREVFADKEVMKAINAQVVPIMIDIDDPNSQELVKRYKIGGTPITIFTDPQGNVLDYAVGKIDKTEFLEMLEKLRAAPMGFKQ
ncbi:thioredoxin family protein [Mangrovibacterium diazotrophicum]|uniref:Protein disulfide-isomerase n=1 Tax=Mangrovibacterium diazotrophicum TaxID=1261403 RepID=A0A419VVF3_9BACT|nr:thioredoxin fold domain-containing protein [Mangrovibacterium diazotrophicum]RKD86139.1 protein disulfide-isomerase [Mangrovibacterium diazotrophicum]